MSAWSTGAPWAASLPVPGSNPLTVPFEPPEPQWARAYENEAASVDAFDDLVDLRLFDVYREVAGRYEYMRPDDAKGHRPRIDRVLIPSSVALAQGWPFGPIGVECKSGRQAIGPTVAQAIDYTRATFEIGGLLDRVFIWPGAVSGGPLGSILYQQRLGVARPSYHGGVNWSLGAGRFDITTVAADVCVGRSGIMDPPTRRAGAR